MGSQAAEVALRPSSHAHATGCLPCPHPPAASHLPPASRLLQSYAKFCKAGEPPFCPEVEVPDPDTSICIPPLPPLFNTPAAGEEPGQLGQQAAEAGDGPADGSVSIGRQLKAWKAGPPASKAGGWGNSSISRPTNLAGTCAGLLSLFASMQQVGGRCVSGDGNAGMWGSAMMLPRLVCRCSRAAGAGCLPPLSYPRSR